MSKPWLPSLFLALSLLAGTPGAHGETYSFGVTPQFERRQLLTIWLPILSELEKRTGHHFQLVTPADIPSFEKQYNSGSFDFAYVNPYLIVASSQKYQPLVRDATPIRGILVVARNSPAHTPADLDGAEIAFPAPNAVGASLLVRSELSRLFHIRFTPRYVNSHTATYLNVAQGLVPAGGGVQKTFDEQKEATRSLLRVIHTTQAVPSLPIAAHPRIAPAVQQAVRAALLDLAASPEGKALVDEIPMHRPVATSVKDYEVLQDMHLDSLFVTGQ